MTLAMIGIVMRATKMMTMTKTKIMTRITTLMEPKKMMMMKKKRTWTKMNIMNLPRRERRTDWKQLDVYSSHLILHAIFKYMNCTLTLSLFVWKSEEMDTEKFVCKKCFFTTERLEKLNTHTKMIHVYS